MPESQVRDGNAPLRVVVIEDDRALNALICESLQKLYFPAQGFYSGEDALHHVREQGPLDTLFLIDFHLEDMSGEQLVRSLQQIRPDIPFVIITGYGDEKIAVDMMKLGALDYLIKDQHFISMLPTTVVQAMNHLKVQRELAESRLALQKSEQKYRLLADHSSDIISRFRWDQTFLYVSPACERMLGYKPEELTGKPVSHLVHPDDLKHVQSNHEALINNKCASLIESYRVRKKDGKYLWVETNSQVVSSPETGLVGEIVGVTRDISERREKEDLVKAKEVAEQANQAKSAFLANLSHEIRNPMNAITGMANTLLKSPVDEVQRNHLNSILFSSKNLLSILNDILDFSKIEAGKVSLTYSVFGLHTMVGELMSMHRPQAGEKGLDFDVRFEDGLPEEVYGDEQKISQVLNNLLSNAIKFTKEGSVILEVGMVQGSTPQLRFSVRDTGIGVKKEEIGQLFDSFRQLDISSRKEYQGTGLGLSIVKSLVELMQGRVSFESEYGKGSVVSFEVPLLGPAGNPKIIHAGEMEKRSLNILIAEDEAINQIYLAGFIRSLGWLADTASNGITALEKFSKGSYDLVLMDGQMPRMDGFEATRRIRDLEKDTDKRTPVIAITGYAIPGDRERFLKAGMDDYISKPIDEEKLLEAIYRLTK